MRSWIRYKVGESLRINYFPKTESSFNPSFLQGEETDHYIHIEDLMNRHLNEEEQIVTELKIYNEMTFREIGVMRGYSKNTAQRTYCRALEKLTPNIEL